ELEDIYLPYKPKRRTKATVAKELGLEPLAQLIMKQQSGDVETWAAKFLTGQVDSVEMALQGARDIIAEWISENQQARQKIRNMFNREAFITSKVIKGKEEEGIKFSDYFEFSELLKKCPSHRMLAIRRGEAEGFLKVVVDTDVDCDEVLENQFVKGYTHSSEQIRIAIKDSYKRLIQPSMENEFKKLFKEKADEEAIQVFARNLRQLLLASPLGQKRILAIDPGFRTGCKIVCLNEQGDLLHNEAIYPHPPQNEKVLASKKIQSLVNSYKIDAVAIGNGTASRETESFIKTVRFEKDIQVFMVNESGASIYSASALAREEFPQYDVTVRGAVSIGRRLMDPLAELVKLDPKSIGVGQYQHDVDQGRLKENLDFVVESCVNTVGVNVNTASMHLLAYVSGLGPKLAQNIVDYRKENGSFGSRIEIKKVPRMGEKAFEQCAGFLRIPGAKNPLDNSAVHPESYTIVDKMAKDLGCAVTDLIKEKELRQKMKLENYITKEVGLPTLQDIFKELEKPGRDPRTQIKVFEFAEGIHNINDLQLGMVLPGIVTNITNFGAFVDIGVHQDGLVHISQMADKYISNPSEVVALHQHVKVKVVEIDATRKRIQLSMKGLS
ncbi:MAG TPA: RNA-binding transcriptional accessory protein, partial [Marinilabiliales bacterium]|nr:RNA-binding transcriptional accessory protein [Marinilabiliales bacterium]